MSKLSEIVPGTNETRLQNIKNAVSLLKLAKDPPPISVDVEMMAEILECADAWLEARRHKPGLHYCQDWDYLLIDRKDPEFQACGCYKK